MGKEKLESPGRHKLAMPSFVFNDAATTEVYTLSLHDALPIWVAARARRRGGVRRHALPELRPAGPDAGGCGRRALRLRRLRVRRVRIRQPGGRRPGPPLRR